MTLTTPMKVVLAVIITAVIGLGFWVLDWQAKQNKLAGIDKTLEDKKAELDRIENDVKKIDELVKVNNDLKAQLKIIISSGFVPEKDDAFVPNYIESVEKLVARVAIEDNDPSFDIVSITPGAQTTGSGPPPAAGKDDKGKDKGGAVAPAPEALRNYPTRTFQMSMKGRYETLVDFLDRLGRLELQRLITVNKLSLTPTESKDTSSPILSITMPLTAYLRTGGGEQ
ncbi:MAG: hypothetical protein FJX76_27730 [Armatimonadetes bacterium]|nr:hypothetical protein [Armatimonadota bacterium]